LLGCNIAFFCSFIDSLKKRNKKKNADSVNSGHGLGKYVVLCSAPLSGCRETHNMIPPGDQKEERLFSRDQMVGRHGPAHHQEYCSNFVGVVFDVSFCLYAF
jgi:hypothetical protein